MFELKEGMNIVLKGYEIVWLNDTYVFVRLNRYETLAIYRKDIDMELTKKVNEVNNEK